MKADINSHSTEYLPPQIPCCSRPVSSIIAGKPVRTIGAELVCVEGGWTSRAQAHLLAEARSVRAMPEVLVPLGMMAGAAMGEWLSNRRSGEGI